jgi:hypothetical protein
MMHSLRYAGMAIMLLNSMGLVGIGGMAALLISVASGGQGLTWAAFKERLPAFLMTVGALLYATVFIMQRYGG